MGELAFKPRRDARMRRSDFRCPVHPSDRWTGGPGVGPLGRVGSARASEQSVAMQVLESVRFTILIMRQELTDGRTWSAALPV